MARFALVIEGLNWTDLDEIEMSQPPAVGEPIGTKYGTCLVTRFEPLPDSPEYAGKITCRLP
ncbi:MAG TPA: hypothetical protein VJU60_03185 [Thermoleophilaceae bacterium]|nr:hypothetical protein [Thermoleophilaceae bacterium]